MSEFKRVSSVLQEADGMLFFECNGCGMPHGVNISRDCMPKWSFDGNYEKPTFSPSVLVQYPYRMLENGEREQVICHSFVVNGSIQYLSDCTHHLAGKTIQLPVIED